MAQCLDTEVTLQFYRINCLGHPLHFAARADTSHQDNQSSRPGNSMWICGSMIPKQVFRSITSPALPRY